METATQLGKYRLATQLAVGGMGEVFLARQEGPAGFSKNVVIKRILKGFAQEPAFIEMFLNEARLAATLEHPNVVQIFELGEEDGTWFIAMEYIHGPSLRRVRQRLVELGCPFPPAIAARLCSQALQGLHYAHTLRDEDGAPLEIVHRDVSPDNLLVGFNGVTKVVDFGIAKAAGTVSTTRAGAVKGKFAYMPPEQILARPLDGRGDVYAMGVVLYELLTGGVRPFQATSDPGLMRAILQESPPPLRAYCPHVPPVLEAVVMKAIARNPDERFQSAEEMSTALEAYIHSTGQTLTGAHIGSLLKELFPEEAASRLPQPVGAKTPSGTKSGAAGTAAGTGHGSGSGSGITPSAERWKASARQEQEALVKHGVLPAGTPPPMLANPVAANLAEESLPSALILDIDVDLAASGVAPRPRPGTLSSGGTPRSFALGAPQPRSKRPLLIVGAALALFAAGAGVVVSASGDAQASAQSAAPALALPAAVTAPEHRATAEVESPEAPAAVAAPVERAAEAVKAHAPPEPEGAPTRDAEDALEEEEPKVARAAPATTRRARAARTRAVVEERPEPAAPATGTVTLRVNPWAEVYLGGRSLGITPIDPVVLPAGSHTFVLKNPKLGLEKRLEARVKPGADVLVKADLLE